LGFEEQKDGFEAQCVVLQWDKSSFDHTMVE
jgi:hypothetical protein